MKKSTDKVKDAIGKVADAINEKRRAELIRAYFSRNEYAEAVRYARMMGSFKKGGKNMRKVASMPPEVDAFFTKLYGPDYYHEPDFFNKWGSEWKVYEGN